MPETSATGAGRSPQWPGVRAAYLKDHSLCAACGGDDYLQVHHIMPFHLDRTLELEPKNLITLCEQPAYNCHFTWGHFHDWYGYNPNVKRDSAHYRRICAAKKP
jgi:hypothetical protein